MSALAKIHVAKKQLGLEEDDYRALLQRATGKVTAKLMTPREHLAVLAEFERLGFKARPARAPRPAHVRHIYALWGDLQKHGAVICGPAGAKALRAFVRRQTGIAAPEFLTPAQAMPVTEGLKAWIARIKHAEGSSAQQGCR
jgi:phage gp16-like protein